MLNYSFLETFAADPIKTDVPRIFMVKNKFCDFVVFCTILYELMKLLIYSCGTRIFFFFLLWGHRGSKMRMRYALANCKIKILSLWKLNFTSCDPSALTLYLYHFVRGSFKKFYLLDHIFALEYGAHLKFFT